MGLSGNAGPPLRVLPRLYTRWDARPPALLPLPLEPSKTVSGSVPLKEIPPAPLWEKGVCGRLRLHGATSVSSERSRARFAGRNAGDSDCMARRKTLEPRQAPRNSRPRLLVRTPVNPPFFKGGQGGFPRAKAAIVSFSEGSLWERVGARSTSRKGIRYGVGAGYALVFTKGLAIACSMTPFISTVHLLMPG